MGMGHGGLPTSRDIRLTAHGTVDIGGGIGEPVRLGVGPCGAVVHGILHFEGHGFLGGGRPVVVGRGAPAVHGDGRRSAAVGRGDHFLRHVERITPVDGTRGEDEPIDHAALKLRAGDGGRELPLALVGQFDGHGDGGAVGGCLWDDHQLVAAGRCDDCRVTTHRGVVLLDGEVLRGGIVHRPLEVLKVAGALAV